MTTASASARCSTTSRKRFSSPGTGRARTDVDDDILWNIVTVDFPPLASQIRTLLPVDPA